MFSWIGRTADFLTSDFPTLVPVTAVEDFLLPLRISFALALVFSIAEAGFWVGPLSPLRFFSDSRTCFFWTLVIVDCMLLSEEESLSEDVDGDVRGLKKDLFASIR